MGDTSAPRPRRWPPADLREVLNAILYMARTGCQRRMLSRDSPPWSAVHTWFRRRRRDGTWEKVNEALRRLARRRARRHPSPRASTVDSQSARTTEAGGKRGYDTGRKVKGR